jgi:hypothetical protein
MLLLSVLSVGRLFVFMSTTIAHVVFPYMYVHAARKYHRCTTPADPVSNISTYDYSGAHHSRSHHVPSSHTNPSTSVEQERLKISLKYRMFLMHELSHDISTFQNVDLKLFFSNFHCHL